MSSHKEKYNKKFGFPKGTSHSIADMAKTTKIKKSILQQVYNRGTGAWKNNIASVRLKSGKKDFSVTDRSKKMSKEQWSYSRVYSFLTNGTTSRTADKDLYAKRFK